ncbi:hypothetical protein NDU88_007747 [Pleurodeles waltl]|uniref:Secreted protein n=1 Tax=Pleurodeles waltl TaxID=8319 RepID=A0AAV7PMJ2_PLEWA|nr:hypothetical protein NDU88_007747 [Pleurodeles waltl]
MVVGVVSAVERGVVLGVLVRVLVAVVVVHAGESVDDTGREEGDDEEWDTVKAVDVAVSVWYLWNKGTKSKSHKQVGDGQMPRKGQLRVQRSFYWTEEAKVSAGTKRARDFPFGGRIPLAVESRAEVFSRRKNANKPC